MNLLNGLYNKSERARQHWHAAMFRLKGGEIENPCYVEGGIDIRLGIFEGQAGNVQISSNCRLSPGVMLHAFGGNITIGPHCFLGPQVIIYGHGDVEIGEGTLIAAHSRIVSAEHTIPDSKTSIRSQPDIRKKITIGNDVWLGAGCTILAGVTIGDGCVIGAGSVVKHSLEPYSIAVGIPAKKIRERKT